MCRYYSSQLAIDLPSPHRPSVAMQTGAVLEVVVTVFIFSDKCAVGSYHDTENCNCRW